MIYSRLSWAGVGIWLSVLIVVYSWFSPYGKMALFGTQIPVFCMANGNGDSSV